ncbi:hypothetical protein SB748_29005 [Rhizobium sp. SIMBA_035]
MNRKGIETSYLDSAIDAVSASHILHPHRHFRHPDEVAQSPLSTAEKRAILASWASDLYAVESLPELRHPPGLAAPVRYREVLEALKRLDNKRDVAWPSNDHRRQRFLG